MSLKTMVFFITQSSPIIIKPCECEAAEVNFMSVSEIRSTLLEALPKDVQETLHDSVMVVVPNKTCLNNELQDVFRVLGVHFGGLKPNKQRKPKPTMN